MMSNLEDKSAEGNLQLRSTYSRREKNANLTEAIRLGYTSDLTFLSLSLVHIGSENEPIQP